MNKINIITQLGGKFSKEDDGLFKLKTKLKEASVKVNFPEGDKIITIQNGVPLTFDPAKETRSFYEVEIQYLQSVKKSDFHVVYNKHLDNVGYIGESASVEVAYALVHNKPICLMYEPVFSDKVNPSIRNLIEKNRNKIIVNSLLDINENEFIKFLADLKERTVNYAINFEDEFVVYSITKQLLESYIVRV